MFGVQGVVVTLQSVANVASVISVLLQGTLREGIYFKPL